MLGQIYGCCGRGFELRSWIWIHVPEWATDSWLYHVLSMTVASAQKWIYSVIKGKYLTEAMERNEMPVENWFY